MKRLKYAEQKIFCICVDIYKIYEDNNYDKIYEVSSTLKNKKSETNIILIEKYKDMFQNPNFEQDYWSKTARGIYKIEHNSIRLMKWICYYDRPSYENSNYFDLMASISICLKNDI